MGADSLHVSGCTPQLEFGATPSIVATNGRILISEGQQVAFGTGKLPSDNRNGCEKYNDSDDDDEWFLAFDEKRNDVHLKHCKVLI